MSAALASLEELRQRRAEWRPWLNVIEEVLREVEHRDWDMAISSVRFNVRSAADRESCPSLAGASLTVPRKSIARLLKRLIATAGAGGSPTLATLWGAIDGDVDVLPLFKAALCHDSELLERVADTRGIDGEGFQAVLSLVCVPLLQACGRQLESSMRSTWTQSYCPVCGTWPAFAEERGIERSRHLRCGRCGAEWHAHGLSCVYCGVRDHEALVTLVPEKGRSPGVVEVCTGCRGYLKVLTRLRGCSAAAVLLEDLVSVPLDIAARSEGFTRPTGAGFPLDVTVDDRS